MEESGIHLETVDKRLTTKSPVMECKGLERCLDHITNITIKVVTTDASRSIKCLLGKQKFVCTIIYNLMLFRKQLSQHSSLLRCVAQSKASA